MEDLTYEQWDTVIGAHRTGPFLCAQEAIRVMKAQDPRGGRIINNGSISVYVPRPKSAPYTATKHAIMDLTSQSRSTVEVGHRLRKIDIGNAATEMTQRMTGGVPQANGTTMVEPRMDVQSVAAGGLYMANLPLDANCCS